jgi:hypothetical protein
MNRCEPILTYGTGCGVGSCSKTGFSVVLHCIALALQHTGLPAWLISQWCRRTDVRFQPKVSLLVWSAWNLLSSTVIDSFQRPSGYNLPVHLRFTIDFFRKRTWEHQGMMTPFIILEKERAWSDDVLYILQVNSVAYQIQKDATILTFMFSPTLVQGSSRGITGEIQGSRSGYGQCKFRVI